MLFITIIIDRKQEKPTNQKEVKNMDEYEKFLDYAKKLKVRAVYKKMYPTDDLADEIDPKLTFKQAYDRMFKGECIYHIIGIGDSVIRERIFAILSELYGVTYDEIYNLWK